MEDFAIGMRKGLQAEPAPVKMPQGNRWADWLRRPAVSMAIGFAAVILVIGLYSSRGSSAANVAPTASLQLTAMRGEMTRTVPARQFDLTLADGPREGGPYRVEVVNQIGARMWSGLATGGPAGVHVNVTQKLLSGDYFVRLYDADGKVLREYGFRVRA